MNFKRVLAGPVLVALVAAIMAVPGTPLASGALERLTNGNFESGFRATPVGFVGQGWGWFTNCEAACSGFYDETWAPVVYDGQHGQLIEINTFGCGAYPDRYAGIFQTVAVVPGETYDLSFHGMLRALADDPDRAGYNYRVQYGIDFTGGDDWTAVRKWLDVPWNMVHPRLAPGAMESFTTAVKATGPRLTLYVRAWKKWATANRELDVNLDAISLKGTMPAEVGTATEVGVAAEGGAVTEVGAAAEGGAVIEVGAAAEGGAVIEVGAAAEVGFGGYATGPAVTVVLPKFPVASWAQRVEVASSDGVGVTWLELFDNDNRVGRVQGDPGLSAVDHVFIWYPQTPGSHVLKGVVTDAAGATSVKAKVVVGNEGEFLVNGSFEGGFYAAPLGAVGNGWSWFSNGGAVCYGFHDETWVPVVYDGEHSQLIEIDTFCRGASDPDRYAGIYQTVSGLTPGATYRLTLHGMLRALADDPDGVGYDYRIQWGYDPNAGKDWTVVNNWIEMPFDTVYPRLAPGTMDTYTVELEAPAKQITIFIRVWQKWGAAGRELDVNLDAISLRGFK